MGVVRIQALSCVCAQNCAPKSASARRGAGRKQVSWGVAHMGGGRGSRGAVAMPRVQPDGYTFLLGGTLAHVNEALRTSDADLADGQEIANAPPPAHPRQSVSGVPSTTVA